MKTDSDPHPRLSSTVQSDHRTDEVQPPIQPKAADSTFGESAKFGLTQSDDPIEICLAHQERAWSSGDRCTVEEVVQLFPILDGTQEFETLLALICNEVFLREENGELPTLVEYQERFPRLADSLQMQWEIDGLLTLHESKSVRSDQELKTRRLIDRYEILSELGRGAMGVVYLAWDPELKRNVALKRLRTGADSSVEEVARIRTEAEAIAQIQHPAIVQVFDVGEVDELPYLTMEYCAGGTLAKRLDGKPILPQSAAELMRKICGGVAAAHERRIIHRDLKPTNILLECESDWSPKVSDFGLAKLLDSDATATATGSVLGTPAYMSPEQAFGDAKRVGPATDVYSLGAILYECLTGRSPFLGVTIADTLQQVREREPISVRQLEIRVPLDLETITHKCMRKDPQQRYVTVAELQDDLSRFLNRQPIRGRRERWLETASRLARKYPLITSLTTASALLLIAVTVVSLVFAKSMMDANVRIRESEIAAKLGQANALVSGAHAIRVSRQPGQHFEALSAIREAAKIGHNLNQPFDWYESMRDEAISALVLPDVHIGKYRDEAQKLKYSDFSDDHQLLALSFESGPTVIRQLSNHRELATVPRLDKICYLNFIGSDRLLQLGRPNGEIELWNVGLQQPQRIWNRSTLMKTFKLSPNQSIVIVDDAKTAEVIKTSDGSTLAKFSPKPYAREPVFAIHPTHPYLIVCSYFEPGVELRNWETGETILRYRLEDDEEATFSGAAWSNDGRRLAIVTSNGQALVWFRFNPNSGDLKLERAQRPSLDLSGGGPHISFNESSDRLLVYGWSNCLGLIDANWGVPLFSSPAAFATIANMPRSDPRESLAGLFLEPGKSHRIGMMNIAHGRERTFLNSEQEKGGTLAIPDPAGRMLAFALGDKLSVVDVATKKLLLTKQWAGLSIESLCFCDNFLYVDATDVCFQLPYRLSGERDSILTLGIPERLHIPASNITGLAASRDGKTIASCCYDGYASTQYAGCWVKLENEPAARKVADLLSGYVAKVTSDGKLFGFSSSLTTTIFSQGDGQANQVKSFPETSQIAFSGHGKRVCVGDAILRTDDWSSEPRTWDGTLFDLSTDGKQVSSDTAKNVACLSYASSATVYARIEGYNSLFLPDASRVVTSVNGRHALYDLKLIRQGVLDLGIPWTGPDYANCVEPVPVDTAKFVDEMTNIDNASDLFRVMDRHCEERARQNPEDGHVAYSAAMVSIDRRNFPEALERLDRSCRLLPKAITPRQWRAYLLAEMRRWPEAIADAAWVLKRINDTRFRLLRAEWLVRNSEFEHSIEECTAIIENAQGFVTLAHGLRHLNHVALGHIAQAKEDRDYFFKNTSDDADSISDSAYCMVGSDISLRQPTLARLYIEKLESLQTDFKPNLRDTIGMVFFRNDDYLKAINYLSPNLGDSTNDLYAYALSVITMCNAKLNNHDAAKLHLKKLEVWQPPAGIKFNCLLEIQQLKAEVQITCK